MLWKRSDKQRDPLWLHFAVLSLLGVGIAYVDARLSYNFGTSIDSTVALGLGGISIGAGIMPVMAIYQWQKGHKDFAKFLSCVAVALFAFNCLSNMGVSTANRVVEVADANVKKANYQEQAKATEEAKARLAIFQKQLTTLIADNAWAATVTADGLRQQVADLRVSRESEANLGGCGQKCRAIENQIAEIQGRISVVEQRQTLDSRIDATKKVLADARSTLASADSGISHTASQASLYSRWTIGWFEDGEGQGALRNANEAMGMLMAIVIAIASVGFTLASIWPYLMTITPDTPIPGARSPQADPVPTAQALPETPAPPRNTLPVSVTTIGQLNMQRLRERLAGSDLRLA